MQIVFVSRKEWGASLATEDFIEKRKSDPPAAKTEIHVHHTAAIDIDDTTPNRWDYDEARAYMRRLQTSRPDLGPLPYSENLAVSEDLQTVWVFQGRGILKRGAHTGGHNVPGVGWGVFGNFDKPDKGAAFAAMMAIEARAAHYRDTGVTPKLGTTLNPHGWQAWGHRDTSTKTCPGHSLYPQLAGFDLDRGGNMAHPADSFTEYRTHHDIGQVPSWSPWDEYVAAGGSSVPKSGTWAYTRADIAWFWKKWIVPLQRANRTLQAELAALEEEQARLETGLASALARIKALEEAPPGGGTPTEPFPAIITPE